MKNIGCLLLIALFLVAGCSTQECHTVRAQGEVQLQEEVHYYDRNGDGRVDLETHHYPGLADADWELRDDNYDGRYEKKILYGVGVRESVVDIPVPSDVKIEKVP